MDARSARRRAAGSGEGRGDWAAHANIGAMLRAAYDDLSRQPLPNEHVDLLLALRRKERDLKRKS